MVEKIVSLSWLPARMNGKKIVTDFLIVIGPLAQILIIKRVCKSQKKCIHCFTVTSFVNCVWHHKASCDLQYQLWPPHENHLSRDSDQKQSCVTTAQLTALMRHVV